MFLPPSTTAANWAIDWSTVLARTESVLKIVALAVTGGWAYFRYVKGRTFRSRIEPTVTGAVFDKDGDTYIIVTLGLKNVGLSRVPVEQKGTVLLVSTCPAPSRPFLDLSWSEPLGFEVFINHSWIEPGEPIQDKVSFQLPAAQIAVKLTFHFVSTKLRWTAGDIISIATSASGTSEAIRTR
jgi:hypothetical protein